jgi:hypothetical protein
MSSKLTYKVVSFDGDAASFVDLVNEAIQDGFEPIGGVGLHQQNGKLRPTFYQAVVKGKKEKVVTQEVRKEKVVSQEVKKEEKKNVQS